MDKFIYVCVLIIYYVWRWTATGQTLLQIHSVQPAEATHFQWALNDIKYPFADPIFEMKILFFHVDQYALKFSKGFWNSF